MTNKKSTEETNSVDNEYPSGHRASLREELFFEVFVKRESRLFSKWRKRLCTITYVPYDRLTMTISIKDKKTAEEVIDLSCTNISKRCSVVESYHCFGFEVDNGRRYLVGRESESRILVMFDNVMRLWKYVKKNHLALEREEQPDSKQDKRLLHYELEFEPSEIISPRDHLLMKKEEPPTENTKN